MIGSSTGARPLFALGHAASIMAWHCIVVPTEMVSPGPIKPAAHVTGACSAPPLAKVWNVCRWVVAEGL